MRRCLLLLVVPLLLVLAPFARATGELPAIGIGGNTPLHAGMPAQVLISHASYPHLEDFSVSVTYQGPISRTEELGHPNDSGILAWTPKQGGAVLLKAVAPSAPGAVPLEISREFKVAGDQPFPNWSHVVGLGLGLLVGLLLRQQFRNRRAKKAAIS